MGSTAFDKPEDTNVHSMAEQWLYATTATIKDKHRHYQYHRKAHPLSKLHIDFTKSATLDINGGGINRHHHETSDSDVEGNRGIDVTNRGGRSSDDDFLVTASDPELSSLRYTEGRVPPLSVSKIDRPKEHRIRHRSVSISEAAPANLRRLDATRDDLEVDGGELDDIEDSGDDDAVVNVVKPTRHRLHRKSSLNRVTISSV